MADDLATNNLATNNLVTDNLVAGDLASGDLASDDLAANGMAPGERFVGNSVVGDAYDIVWEKPDVYRIRIPFTNLGQGCTNCYVVHDAGQWLIVDVGAAGACGREKLTCALSQIGVDFSACTLFLTHAHFDHAGLIDDVLPGCVPVVLSAAAFEAHQPGAEDVSHGLFLRRMCAAGALPYDAQKYADADRESITFDAHLRRYTCACAGDVIVVGRLVFQVKDIAGHTADHLALYEPQYGLLFSGDHVLFSTTPSVDTYPGDADGLALYQKHLRMVQDLPLAQAFLGHDDPVSYELSPRVDQIIKHKRDRVRHILHEVRTHPESDAQSIARQAMLHVDTAAWGRKPVMVRYYALLETFAALQHLCATDQVIRTFDDGWCVYRYRVC